MARFARGILRDETPAAWRRKKGPRRVDSRLHSRERVVRGGRCAVGRGFLSLRRSSALPAALRHANIDCRPFSRPPPLHPPSVPLACELDLGFSCRLGAPACFPFLLFPPSPLCLFFRAKCFTDITRRRRGFRGKSRDRNIHVFRNVTSKSRRENTFSLSFDERHLATFT